MFFSLHFALIIIIVFVAGFLGAVSGGGGMITLPAILTLGVNPVTALGTNKMLATLTTFSSARVFVADAGISLKLWFPFIISTTLGSIGGVILTHWVPSHTLYYLIPLFIIIASIYSVFYQPGKTKPTIEQNVAPPILPLNLLSLGIAFFLGVYSGFIGTGLGIFWSSIVMAVYQFDIMQSTTISRIMCFTSNFVAFVSFLVSGSVNLWLGSLLGAVMAVGSYYGARSALKWGVSYVKLTLLLISLVTSVYLLFGA